MRLVLTGGGTGGHIVPNIALIQGLKDRHPKDLELLYIGSRGGASRSMEERMMKEMGVPFKAIATGKIRRYFSLMNLVDFFKIPIGIVQAIVILVAFKPRVVFAKGGYVSFPVAVAAWLARVPVVLHESDVMPGLANRVCAKFARKVLVSFEESLQYFPARKTVLTGNPVRKEIFEGDAKRGRDFAGLKGEKPVVLVMGGSQGAQFLNELVWDHIEKFLREYEVVHICGEGKKRDLEREGYAAFEFVGDEIKDLYALADVVVTRGGAMTLAELAAASKPAILIPLGRKASRGDQIVNARAYAKQHTAEVMEEESFKIEPFWSKLKELSKERPAHTKGAESGAAERIIALLEEV